jgi:hypothetical protein
VNRAALLVAVLAACDRGATVTACDDVLTGAYATPTGRWMLLDHGRTLEAYPIEFDAPRDRPDVIVAPRAVELHRDGATVAGELHRRYMVGAERCEARAPVRLRGCGHDALDVELGEVAAPLTFTPCTWSPPPPPRREAWRREP